MLVITLLYFLVQCVGPILEIVNIIGNICIFDCKYIGTVVLYIDLIAIYYFIKEVFLLPTMNALQHDLLFISDEFVIVLLGIFLVVGMEVVDGGKFLYATYFTEFVYVIESGFISH